LPARFFANKPSDTMAAMLNTAAETLEIKKVMKSDMFCLDIWTFAECPRPSL
jgi:hypothetical protein